MGGAVTASVGWGVSIVVTISVGSGVGAGVGSSAISFTVVGEDVSGGMKEFTGLGVGGHKAL